MALEKTDVIDFVSVKEGEEYVLLTIADELNWEDEKKHINLLQEKINNYLTYIENGELYKAYPYAKYCKLAIRIIARYVIPKLAIKFLEKASTVINEAGYGFSYVHRPSKND